VEADFQRYYQLHICELGGAQLSWRRFVTLLHHLPPESATARLQRGGEGTVTNELLAVIASNIAAGNWQRSGGKGQRPRPIRLNGEADPDRARMGTAVPIEEMRSLLDDWAHGATETGSEVTH
jgi:hypothetical protein